MNTQLYYTLGKKLGLTKNDIDQILNSTLRSDETITFSQGPPFYQGGTRYGTVSVKVFLNNKKQ